MITVENEPVTFAGSKDTLRRLLKEGETILVSLWSRQAGAPVGDRLANAIKALLDCTLADEGTEFEVSAWEECLPETAGLYHFHVTLKKQ